MIVDSLKFKGKGGLRDFVTVNLKTRLSIPSRVAQIWITDEKNHSSVDQRNTVENANLQSLPGQRHYFHVNVVHWPIRVIPITHIHEPAFQLESQLRETESESLAGQRDTYVISRGEEPREPRTDLQTLEQEGGVDKNATELWVMAYIDSEFVPATVDLRQYTNELALIRYLLQIRNPCLQCYGVTCSKTIQRCSCWKILLFRPRSYPDQLSVLPESAMNGTGYNMNWQVSGSRCRNAQPEPKNFNSTQPEISYMNRCVISYT